jgi:hypothetical protein
MTEDSKVVGALTSERGVVPQTYQPVLAGSRDAGSTGHLGLEPVTPSV